MNIYVNVNAPMQGIGTEDRPFKHIDDAARNM